MEEENRLLRAKCTYLESLVNYAYPVVKDRSERIFWRGPDGCASVFLINLDKYCANLNKNDPQAFVEWLEESNSLRKYVSKTNWKL